MWLDTRALKLLSFEDLKSFFQSLQVQLIYEVFPWKNKKEHSFGLSKVSTLTNKKKVTSEMHMMVN